MRKTEKIVKIKKASENRCISRICGGGTAEGSKMNFGTSGKVHDVINLPKFRVDRLYSLRAAEVEFEGLALKPVVTITTMPCAAALACNCY